jgi:site-specific DNA-cytosine methylase
MVMQSDEYQAGTGSRLNPLYVIEMMGFPGELADLSFPAWCRESIKACGNAIVPQVALQIFETINKYENLTKPR